MAESFQDVLGKLIKEHGMALLDNSARCNALLQDYTQGQFKKETRLLLQALEAGYYKELKNTQDPEIARQKLIQKFQDEYGSSEKSAEETISLLMRILNIPDKTNQRKIAEQEQPTVARPNAAPVQQKKKPIARNVIIAVGVILAIVGVFAYIINKNSFQWVVENGTITITGYNEILTGIPPGVTIPSRIKGIDVTSIGDGAFLNSWLKKITMPNSVTSIGNAAFSGNELTSITIPNSVTNIGDNAFARNHLTSITIPSSVTSIGGEAFAYNPELISINVDPQNQYFTSVDGILFSKDRTLLHTVPRGKKLTTYIMPNSVTRIGNGAFDGSKLKSITIPNGVTNIGDRAFAANKLTSITIPNSVTSIGDEAFEVNKLTSITIPNSVTSIGSRAFWYNELTNITISDSVVNIGDMAFIYNQTTSITMPKNINVDRGDTFDKGFANFYNENGKEAGTYRWNGYNIGGIKRNWEK
ncbi:hypothetical protein FACS1894109_06670 [Spirochaetia bacterium]|nr:hypothetical protein FACS1894109_06670 [Spirochaetia bacterium]